MGTNKENETIPWITDADWINHNEGQLAVDVIEDDKNVFIRSAIAGVDSKDLDISVTDDTVTIRGQRQLNSKETKETTVHIQECHWGGFSRSIILPTHVRSEKADAKLKNGILTITIPKAKVSSTIKVKDID
jgi:HSP20 family protein